MINVQTYEEIFYNYSNPERKVIYDLILESEENGSYPKFPIRFFFHDQNKWIAVDNSDNCCFVEEFDNISDAINWLKEYAS